MRVGVTRRGMTTLVGAALAGGPSRVLAQAPSVGGRSPLFYKPPPTDDIWDTTVVYRDGRYFLFHPNGPDSTSLAISPDGVFWSGRGRAHERAGNSNVWSVKRRRQPETFFKAYYREGSRTAMHFVRSTDLVHWTRAEADFRSPDERWYDLDGRWGDLWVIPRAGGGFYGYAVANAKGAIGLGFGESDDGLHWTSRPPALVLGTSLEPGNGPFSAPEVSAVREWRGAYYAVLGLDDLDFMFKKIDGKPDFSSFRPGHTTMVASSASGPFRPAPTNRRLLVGNNAYFLRFVETPDGVLANHHCWEVDWSRRYGTKKGEIYLAPLKRAEWDGAGTLRLKWWEGNEKAKGVAVPVNWSRESSAAGLTLLAPNFEPGALLIVEGLMRLPHSTREGPIGLYFEDPDEAGTAFLVRPGGLVEYGRLSRTDFAFERLGIVDRELKLREQVRFRLVRKGRITEFYIDDYLMQCFCLPSSWTGRIGVLGPAEHAGKLKAWLAAE